MENTQTFCISCMDYDKELISLDQNTMDLYQELITAELPHSFQNHVLHLCFDCVCLLRKFKNFKRSAIESIPTVSNILRNRIKEEKDETTKMAGNGASTSGKVPKLVVQLQRSSAAVSNVIRRPNEEPSTSNAVPKEEPVLINPKRKVCEILESQDGDQNRKKMYEEILKNQPKVELRRINETPFQIFSPPIVPIPSTSSTSSDIDPDRFCSECKTTINELPFANHILRVHLQSTPEGIWKCKICSKALKTELGAINHFDTHRKFIKVKKCDQCSLIFTRYFPYKRHFSTCHKVQHICAHCNKGFGDKNLWMRHVIEKHPDNRRCLECSQLFENKHSYFQHISQQHENYSMKMEMLNHHQQEQEASSSHNNDVLNGLLTTNNGNSSLLTNDELLEMSVPLLQTVSSESLDVIPTLCTLE